MIVKSSISQTTELTLQAAWYHNIEQSRGIEKEEEKFLIIDTIDTTTTGLCGTP
jgi:hypothetical protein